MQGDGRRRRTGVDRRRRDRRRRRRGDRRHATTSSTAAGARGARRRGGRAVRALDILINNAGIIRWAGLARGRRRQPRPAPRGARRRLVQHHPRRVAAHGRAAATAASCMTTSAGIFGLPSNLSYATAKGGVIGLTRSLDDRGRRARHQGQPDRARGDDAHGRPRREPTSRRATRTTAMAPELVAPMVAFLAHEDCPVSGEIYAAGARPLRAHLHRVDRGLRARRRRRRPSRTSREHWADDQRRDRLLRPRRPHGLVGHVHWRTCTARRASVAVAQLALQDLARRVPRQRVDERRRPSGP